MWYKLAWYKFSVQYSQGRICVKLAWDDYILAWNSGFHTRMCLSEWNSHDQMSYSHGFFAQKLACFCFILAWNLRNSILAWVGITNSLGLLFPYSHESENPYSHRCFAKETRMKKQYILAWKLLSYSHVIFYPETRMHFFPYSLIFQEKSTKLA